MLDADDEPAAGGQVEQGNLVAGLVQEGGQPSLGTA